MAARVGQKYLFACLNANRHPIRPAQKRPLCFPPSGRLSKALSGELAKRRPLARIRCSAGRRQLDPGAFFGRLFAGGAQKRRSLSALSSERVSRSLRKRAPVEATFRRAHARDSTDRPLGSSGQQERVRDLLCIIS